MNNHQDSISSFLSPDDGSFITSTFFYIKFFSLDYLVFQIFLYIVGFIFIIYFNIYIYIYIYVCVCVCVCVWRKFFERRPFFNFQKTGTGFIFPSEYEW